MKTVKYEKNDRGEKYTYVYTFDADRTAKEIIKEINEIVRDAIQSINPTAFWKHLIEYETITADEVIVKIRGNFVDAFLEKGYEIG